MTQTEILKIQEEILNLKSQLEDAEFKAFALAKKKLAALQEGFGFMSNRNIWIDRNGNEEVNFESDYIHVVFYDKGYDLHETCSTTLSYEEFCMSDEEFDKRLQELKAEKEIKLQKERDEKARLEKEKRLKEFEKLKKEFES